MKQIFWVIITVTCNGLQCNNIISGSFEKWNNFLVPGNCGMVLSMIIQELSQVGFTFSIISIGQWIIVILGQISETQLANSKGVCDLVFSLMHCLHVPPNASMWPFPCDMALKSHSISPLIKFMERIVYFCLKCLQAPSLLNYFLVMVMLGWRYLNLSEICSRKTNTAYLSWFI